MFNLKAQVEKKYLSWGDYQWWHISLFRDAIMVRYGNKSVSEMREDSDGYLCFDHSEEVDFVLIEKDLGVRHSSPSSSSKADASIRKAGFDFVEGMAANVSKENRQ